MDDPEDPSPEEQESVIRALFANFDAQLARVRPEDLGPDRRSDVFPVSRPSPAAAPPSPEPPATPSPTFEAWAALSVRLLRLPMEEKVAVLRSEGLTLEAWTRLDEAYLRALSMDMRAGLRERPALWEGLYKEEMARRGGVAEGAASQEAAVSLPAVVRGPEHLRGTAGMVELPAEMHRDMGRMPFGPGRVVPAGVGAGAGAGAAKTMPVRVAPGLGDTLPVDSDAIQKAVAAVLPFEGDKGGAGVVALPELTVRQYVSLRAELAVGRAEQVGETWKRYGVPNEAAWRALEAMWRERVAGSAEVRGERDAAVGELVRWLRGE